MKISCQLGTLFKVISVNLNFFNRLSLLTLNFLLASDWLMKIFFVQKVYKAGKKFNPHLSSKLEVLKAIEDACNVLPRGNVKINCVVMKGFNMPYDSLGFLRAQYGCGFLSVTYSY